MVARQGLVSSSSRRKRAIEILGEIRAREREENDARGPNRPRLTFRHSRGYVDRLRALKDNMQFPRSVRPKKERKKKGGRERRKQEKERIGLTSLRCPSDEQLLHPETFENDLAGDAFEVL